MAKFHAQIWQYLLWKSARISDTDARRAKISFILTPWGRNRVYVQLLELWPMAKFHAQIWQFWKSAGISEAAVHRVKISSISTPGVEKEYMYTLCGTLANGQVGSQAGRQGPWACCFTIFSVTFWSLIFSFLLRWNNIVGNFSTPYSSCKSPSNLFKPLLNFCNQ